MEESIYNLIPQERASKSAPLGGGAKSSTRYVSKYAAQARKEAKATKTSGAMMGPPGDNKPKPTNFLRKHASDARQDALATTKRRQAKSATQRAPSRQVKQKKPRVPKASDHPVMGITSNKNFLKDNAIKAVTQVPAAKRTNRQGATASAGAFKQKKDYGKVPKYLTKRKEDEAREHADYEDYLRTVQMQDAPYQVPEDERQELLRGLKTNWERLYHDYQGLSVVADTIPKKQRKTRMEAKLAQLEADIKKIESHKVIFVS